MSQKLATLQAALESVLGDKIKRLVLDRGELTITVSATDYEGVARTLRDDASQGRSMDAGSFRAGRAPSG